jgi:hypothetical protein
MRRWTLMTRFTRQPKKRGLAYTWRPVSSQALGFKISVSPFAPANTAVLPWSLSAPKQPIFSTPRRLKTERRQPAAVALSMSADGFQAAQPLPPPAREWDSRSSARVPAVHLVTKW